MSKRWQHRVQQQQRRCSCTGSHEVMKGGSGRQGYSPLRKCKYHRDQLKNIYGVMGRIGICASHAVVFRSSLSLKLQN
eukprot:2580738-Amphidinium_carterae.1